MPAAKRRRLTAAGGEGAGEAAGRLRCEEVEMEEDLIPCKIQGCSFVGRLNSGLCPGCRQAARKAALAKSEKKQCKSQDCNFVGKLTHGFCSECRAAALACERVV